MSDLAQCAEAIGGTPYAGYEFGGVVARNLPRGAKSVTAVEVAKLLAEHVQGGVFHAGNRTSTVAPGDSQAPKPDDTVTFTVDLAANDKGKLAAAMVALGNLGFSP